jgi:hypothetical protein
VKAVYVGGGPIALKRALDTLVRAWGNSTEGLNGEFIRALGAIYSRHGRTVDENRMARQLAKETPDTLARVARIEHAETGGSLHGDGRVAGSIARVMLRLYNKGLAQEKRVVWEIRTGSRGWWEEAR